MSNIDKFSETLAAISIILPSVVAVRFMIQSHNESTKNLYVASVGCIIHCPFSFSLHLYRGYGKKKNIRQILHYFDVSFIHIHVLLTSYSWKMRIKYIDLLYHLFCIVHIWSYYINKSTIDICNYSKKKINIFTACGVLLSSRHMFLVDKKMYFISLLSWVLLYEIYSKKLLGKYSSFVMHTLLSIPQFCVLSAIQNK